MSNFNGKFVVTGAASGVGADLAKLLIAGGADVIALDRKPPATSDMTFIEVDLSQRASIDRAIAQIDGPIQGLANVAGVADTMPKDVVYRVNFLGMRHLTEGLIGKLSADASVVNVASLVGRRWGERKAEIIELLATGSFEQGEEWFAANGSQIEASVPPYTFSKESVIAYSINRGCDLMPNGPRINAICPGSIETPLLRDFIDTMGKEMFAMNDAAVGRAGSAKEIANAVAFLLSDSSAWIKGQAIFVDGGMSACIAMDKLPKPAAK